MFCQNCRSGIIPLIAFIILAPLVMTAVFCTPGVAKILTQDSLFNITITGVEDDIKKNIEAILTLPNGMIRDGKIEPTWAKRFARQAKARVATAMQPFGYYQPETTTKLTRHDNGRYLLEVHVTPGEPVLVEQSEIRISGEGANEPKLERLINLFPLQKGAQLRHRLYDESKGNLQATAQALGYLHADFSIHQIEVDPAARTARVELELATGPRYYFGRISFLGADDFPEQVLRRHLTFNTGEVFSESELAKTQSSLLDSDRFLRSNVSPRLDQVENSAVPIEIDLTPLPRYQLRPGLGYGTDTGPRASLRFKDNNVFRLGHEFKSDLMIADLKQTATTSYLVPLASRAESMMGFSLQFDREDIDTYATQSIAAEASLTHGFIEKVNTTLFLRFSREDYEIGGEPEKSTILVMPGMRIGQRRWRFDQPGRVREGFAWQLEVRGSANTLGSDVSVLQGVLGGSAVIRLADKYKLILRGESGTTLQNEFDDLPPSMRFFTGGDQTVRGYDYKSLGPKDASGDTIGGRHMVVGSIETEYRVNDSWSLALFYDTGNAFDNFTDYELAQGAGIGVRRYTPIGPIKLDLARQLGESKNHYRVHLSVGFGW